MTLAVIDSSVVVKWVIGEPDSPQALELRHFYRFAAPDLITAEAANAIVNKVRRAQVTELEAHAAAELISQLSIEFHPMRSIVAIALKMRHPVYDCMFLALASMLDCPMITADTALIGKSAGLGITVLTMQQAIDQA